MKIKKIIARESLILLGFYSAGLIVRLLLVRCPEMWGIFTCISKDPLANLSFRMWLYDWIFLSYPVYLLIRFIVWVIRKRKGFDGEAKGRKMPKALNQFSGWLIFLFIILCLAVIIGVRDSYIYIYNLLIGESLSQRLIYLIFFIDQMISLMLCLKFLWIIRIKDINTPQKLVRIRTWMLILKSAFSICELIVGYLFFKSATDEFFGGIGIDIGGAIISWLILVNYFKKSKRVLAYYGKNATTQFQI
jgi:hypothetical protein